MRLEITYIEIYIFLGIVTSSLFFLISKTFMNLNYINNLDNYNFFLLRYEVYSNITKSLLELEDMNNFFFIKYEVIINQPGCIGFILPTDLKYIYSNPFVNLSYYYIYKLNFYNSLSKGNYSIDFLGCEDVIILYPNLTYSFDGRYLNFSNIYDNLSSILISCLDISVNSTNKVNTIINSIKVFYNSSILNNKFFVISCSREYPYIVKVSSNLPSYTNNKVSKSINLTYLYIESKILNSIEITNRILTYSFCNYIILPIFRINLLVNICR